MTTENRLKSYILDNYRNIKEFSEKLDMPYTTLDTILKRGIGKASVNNLTKICDALGIDIDRLIFDGIVTPKAQIDKMDLTGEESRLIEKFRKLDTHGREMVEMIIGIELQRGK